MSSDEIFKRAYGDLADLQAYASTLSDSGFVDVMLEASGGAGQFKYARGLREFQDYIDQQIALRRLRLDSNRPGMMLNKQ